MTSREFAAIRMARRACEVNAPAHVGRPLNIRRANRRGIRRLAWWR